MSAYPNSMKTAEPTLAELAEAGPTHVSSHARRNADRCKLAEFYDTDTHGDSVKKMVNDPRWTASDLSRSFARFEINVSASQIRTHRRGDCLCYRKVSA